MRELLGFGDRRGPPVYGGGRDLTSRGEPAQIARDSLGGGGQAGELPCTCPLLKVSEITAVSPQGVRGPGGTNELDAGSAQRPIGSWCDVEDDTLIGHGLARV